MPDLNSIIAFILILFFFVPIANAAIGFLFDQAVDKQIDPCKQHTWAQNPGGMYICAVCKKSPLEDVASPSDFEIEE